MVMMINCLKSSNTLRKQMLSTFGVAAIVSLAVLVLSGDFCVHMAGEIVKRHSSELMTKQGSDALTSSSLLIAEKFSARMAEVDGSIQILVESLQDRIVGYPSWSGWDNGDFVPFMDSITQKPRYPLEMKPVPLDWNVTLQSRKSLLENDDSEDSAMGERLQWYNWNSSSYNDDDDEGMFSTATAAFHFQGTCDVLSSHHQQHPQMEGECSDAHNNVTAGGVIHPTSTLAGLYQATGDLSVFMKPLWECHHDALRLTIYFLNDGAGATLTYPASRIPTNAGGSGKNDDDYYTSFGCDWMSSINNRTGRPYGQSDRCRPRGDVVHKRNYNPMEEEWASFFIMEEEGNNKNENVRWFGPLQDDPSVLKAGKAAYDRLTGELIGFVTADIAIDSFSAVVNNTATLFSEATEVFSLHPTTTPAENGSRSRKEDDDEFQRLAISGHTHPYSTELLSQLAESARQKSKKVFLHNDHLIAPQLVPLPPDNDDDDESYTPQYLVLCSIATSAIPAKGEINEEIENDIRQHLITSSLLGFGGSVLILVILWGVSSALTDPLLWIEDIARRILRDDKSQRRIALDGEGFAPSLNGMWGYAPKTEIYLLVKEFQNVLSGLSGEGASKVANPTPVTIRNSLSYHPEFEPYYGITSDREKHLHHPLSSTTSESTLDSATRTSESRVNSEMSRFQNEGQVVNQSLVAGKPVRGAQAPGRIWRSRLFRWMLILIVIPLLVTNGILGSIVISSVTSRIPEWITKAAEGSESIARQNLQFIAASKASVISSITGSAIRDLHVLTRVSAWLFFDGITRSDSFTEGRSAAEECKSYVDSLCPFFSDPVRNPCACDWDDPWDGKPWPGCFEYKNVSDTRFLQRYHFSVQSLDADPITGNRLSSPSFPALGNTSDSTFWWTNVSAIPGSFKGANASGDQTTYDRLRVASAAAVVFFPIYNYATSLGQDKPILGNYIGFEKDGLFQGSSGCYGFDGEVAFARSNKHNRAAMIAPSLCPEGKYGYDPRCRDWYATGKRLYETKRIPVHVTSPYIFQLSQNTIATGATSPIANPQTDEYVGQVLLDFFSLGLRKSINALNQTVSFVITPEKDITGGDTVIGPYEDEGWRSVAICDLLYPKAGDVNMENFESNVLSKMKAGKSGIDIIMLAGENSSSAEPYYLAFAPASYRLLLPTNPSNFASGVRVAEDIVYAVGIGESASNIMAPFLSALEEMSEELYVGPRNIYISFLIVVSCFFVTFTICITILITIPIITLLEIVRDLNKGIFSEDIPPLKGGCRESTRVFSIFSRLNKIVMVSNAAFFSHDLERANHFLNTALQLFKKIDDEKAIGVASNNLANTLFAKLYLSRNGADCGDPCLVRGALRNYDIAVNICQKAFESAAVRDKASFAERLGDRLFNRGVFLLFCSSYDCAPPDARDRGLEDISRARKIHYEVKDYLLEKKLLFEQASLYWDRLMRRIHVLLALYSDEALRELWDAETLVDEADQLMMAAWQIPTAPLFHEVTSTGRRQQLEGSAILLCRKLGQDYQAFNLAMRMFAQDEYLLESSCVQAAEAILSVAESGEIELSADLKDELKQFVGKKQLCSMGCLTMEKF